MRKNLLIPFTRRGPNAPSWWDWCLATPSRLGGLLKWNLGQVCACLGGLVLLVHTGQASDFSVSTPGGAYAYTINGMQNPALTLVQGKTYTFNVNASSIHPFYINSPGVQNNNITQGTVTYTVPTGTGNYSYYCSYHYFGGQILTVPAPPPPPPAIELLSVSVGSNLVIRSTGTNTWSVQPMFSTNLTSTNWYALAVITNQFLSGTNETICGRPPGDQVFIRIQSRPN